MRTKVVPRRTPRKRQRAPGQTASIVNQGPTVATLTLLECASEFCALRLKLELLLETQHEKWPGDAWTEELEEECARTVEPIRDRLAAVRQVIADRRAETLPELRVKATVLLDLVEADREDIESTLTRSLCNDLMDYRLDAGAGSARLSANRMIQSHG
ncbi:hypothetical protein ACO2I3_08830 [Leptospira interrogans]